MIHPSLLFPHGHFETTPDYDFTDDSDIHKFLSYFPVLKPQDMRHSAPASRSLATWPSQMQTQVMSPKSSTRSITSVDNDTVLINDLNHNFSDFSKTTNENTRQIGVPTVFESSVSRVLMMILLFVLEVKKACNRETVARQREMEEREGFVINVAELMSKKSRRNSIRSSSLQTHTKSYSEESLRKFYSEG